MIHPHKCPVCEGRGEVSACFYMGGGLTGRADSTDASQGDALGQVSPGMTMCRSCQGRGYVLVSERDQAVGQVGPLEYKADYRAEYKGERVA